MCKDEIIQLIHDLWDDWFDYRSGCIHILKDSCDIAGKPCMQIYLKSPKKDAYKKGHFQEFRRTVMELLINNNISWIWEQGCPIEIYMPHRND